MIRKLMIERILFALDEQTMIMEYGICEDELQELSDLDIFELYEEVMGIGV